MARSELAKAHRVFIKIRMARSELAQGTYSVH